MNTVLNWSFILLNAEFVSWRTSQFKTLTQISIKRQLTTYVQEGAFPLVCTHVSSPPFHWYYICAANDPLLSHTDYSLHLPLAISPSFLSNAEMFAMCHRSPASCIQKAMLIQKRTKTVLNLLIRSKIDQELHSVENNAQIRTFYWKEIERVEWSFICYINSLNVIVEEN